MPKVDKVVTESYLERRLSIFKQELKEELKEEFVIEMDKRHNEVMNQLDFIVGRIKKFDEEHDLLSYRVSEHTDQLENHETRIANLENSPKSTPA